MKAALLVYTIGAGLLLSACSKNTKDEPAPAEQQYRTLIIGDWQMVSNRTVATFNDGTPAGDITRTITPGRIHLIYTATTLQAIDNGAPGIPPIRRPEFPYTLNGNVLTNNTPPFDSNIIVELTAQRMVQTHTTVYSDYREEYTATYIR